MKIAINFGNGGSPKGIGVHRTTATSFKGTMKNKKSKKRKKEIRSQLNGRG